MPGRRTARKLATENADKQLTVGESGRWYRQPSPAVGGQRRRLPKILARDLAGRSTIDHNFESVSSPDRPRESNSGDKAVTIVLNPVEQQDASRADVFCWNELPELLLADDLFDSASDQPGPHADVVAEDDDEDEDWDEDEDEEYEDEEEYEEEEYEDDEEEEDEGDEDEGDEEVEEEEWEEVDDEEYEEEDEEGDEEEGDEDEYEDDEEGEDWEDDDEDDWEEEDDD